MNGRRAPARLTKQEVGAQTGGSAETPGDTDRVDAQLSGQVENQYQSGQSQAGSDEDPRRRTAPAPRPMPTNQQHRSQVFQQQRYPNRQVLHAAEVAELREGHGDEPVGDHPTRLSN